MWQDLALSPEELDRLYTQQLEASRMHTQPPLGDFPADIADILSRIANPDSPSSSTFRTPPIAPQGGPAEAPAPVDEGQDVPVQGSRLQRGLLGGWFSIGRPGGNILGALGDAFLTQAGRDRQYAPRLQQRREAEAMQGFATDPIAGSERLGQVNTELGLSAFDKASDAAARQAIATQQAEAARIRAVDQERRRREGVIDRVTRGLGSANATTWPRMRQLMERYLQNNGMTFDDLPFDVPEAFDAAAISAGRMYGVPTNQQMDDEALEGYRSRSLAQRAAAAGSVASNRAASLGERARHNRANERQAAANEAGRNERHNTPRPRRSRRARRPVFDFSQISRGILQ